MARAGWLSFFSMTRAGAGNHGRQIAIPMRLYCSLLLATAGCCHGWDGWESRMRAAMPRYPTTTLLDETICDHAGTCHLLMVRPLSLTTKEPCLYISLSGYGTRAMSKRMTAALDKALNAQGACACVVEMGEARGTAVTSLPIIAGFIAAHRKHLPQIAVLRARGLALSAVKVVARLSKRENIQFHRSLPHFERATGWSTERHRLAIQVAKQAAARAAASSGGRGSSRWGPGRMFGAAERRLRSSSPA